MNTVFVLLGCVMLFATLLATVKRDQENDRKAFSMAQEASRDRSNDWERHRTKK